MGVFAWHDTCSLCARGLVTPRPPTAEEKHSSSIPDHQTNYLRGIYHVDHVPTVDELKRAVW